MIYELCEDGLGSKYIKGTSQDGKELFIPIEPANSDYQRYLRWLENPEAEENGTIS